MGFFRVLWKNNIQNAYLARIRIPGQIVFEVIAQLCSYDAIQIILNLTQFTTLQYYCNSKFPKNLQLHIGQVKNRTH